MTNENHIINKQVFEFSCSRYEDAFQLQKQMESGLQHTIQSSINNAFSDWNDTKEILRIDKLEIDIGEIPFERLSFLLPGKIYTSFSYKLDAAFLHCRTSETGIKKNDNNNQAAILEIFLLSGSLPWWAGAVSEFSIIRTIEHLIENDSDCLKTVLLKHIHNEKFIERLVLQTDAALLEKIIATLQAIEPLNFLFQQFVDKIVERAGDDNGMDEINTLTIGNKENRGLVNNSKNISQLILKVISALALPCTVEQVELVLREKIEKVFDKKIANLYFKELVVTSLAEDIYSCTKILEKNAEHAIQAERFLFDENTLATSDEKIYVQNAGLVLIATFLPALFKELQWIEDGAFKNREMQLKSLFLLHYISTGIETAPEYTLQLNKILCGFKLDEPIPFSVKLTAHEKLEADQLLQDMISHWSVLRSSSAEALRGSFLLRDGLLSHKNGRWLLQVERKGYDVLLDQIPWSWATVKCNWMKAYIETEW